MKLGKMKLFSTKNDLIDFNTNVGEALIVLNENDINLNKILKENNFISANIKGLYYINKMQIGKEFYLTNIDSIREENDKTFSIPTKLINQVNGKSGIFDLSFLVPLLSEQSIITQKSTFRAVLTNLIENLKDLGYASFNLMYIPNKTSTKAKSLFFELLRHKELTEINLFLAGLSDELEFYFVRNSTNYQEQKDLPKIISIFSRVQVLEPTKKEKDDLSISKNDLEAILLKFPPETHNAIKNAYTNKIISLDDIKSSNKREILLNIVANSLSDSNTSDTMKKYDEELYKANLSKRINDFDTKQDKKINLKQTSLSRDTLVNSLLPTKDTIKDFREQYNERILNDDLKNILPKLENDNEYPLVFTDYKLIDSSTKTTLKNTFKATAIDPNGNIIPIEFDIPKVKEDGKSFYIEGTRYILLNQLFSKPVVKLDPDRVAVTTNYAKVMIYRMGEDTSSNKINKAVLTLKNSKVMETEEEIVNYVDGESFKMIGNRNYFEIIDELTKETLIFYPRKGYFSKVFPNLRNDFDSSKEFSFVGYKNSKTDKLILLLDKNGIVNEVTESDINDLSLTLDTGLTLANYINQLTKQKTIFKRTYSRINIIGQKLPLLFVLMSGFSLKSILEASNTKYSIVDYETPIKETQTKRVLKLADAKLVLELNTLEKEYLFNYLSQLSSTDKLLSYKLKELFAKTNNILVENNIKKTTMNAINNNFKYFIDNITEEILKQYLLPTDILNLLLYANKLLANSSSVPANDFGGFRIRNLETVPALVYKELTAELGKFRNQYSRSRVKSKMKFSFPKDRIMRVLVTGLPNVSPLSSSNAALETAETNKVTYGGHLGLNNEQSLTLAIRKTHDSRIGIVDNNALTDSSSVGGVLYMSQDTSIQDLRGTMNPVKLEDLDKVAKENPSKLLSNTLMLEPFGATRSDSMRCATIHIQSNHQFPSPSTITKPLVRTGAEDMIAEKMSDDFVLRSPEKLKIVSINKEEKLIKCVNEKNHDVTITYKDKILKNGGAGFYFNSSYELDKDIKVGKVLKPKDKIAYSTSLFKDGVLAGQGKLVKIALIPSLELVEDAALISESLAKEIELPFVYDKSIDLMEQHYIASFKKIGEKVNAEEDLLEFSEGLPKESKGSQDLLDELFGDDIKRKVRSPAKGIITDIKVIYNKPDNLLQENEKALLAYLNQLDEEDGTADTISSRVIKEPQGKILGRKLNDAMVITYYISKPVNGKSGSKLTL